MDSGNSGSMQSSSGGDEEYDSTFLNNPNSSHNNPTFLLNQSTFFDNTNFPQSQFSNSNSSSNNNNGEFVWPRFQGFGTSSSSSSTPLFRPQNPISGSDVVRGGLMAQPEQPNVGKNPKKRTRASRRAPTTVLTTDTSNFRQMVQEFTGIPTTPFTGSAYSRRLDLFSTAGSAMRSSHLDSLGPLYPLRPSAQKVQVSPFAPQLLSSTTASASASTCASASTSTTTNFRLGSDLGIPKQTTQNNMIMNMQNQILSFKNHPLANNSPVFFATKSPVPSLEELGISHEQVSGFHQGRNDGNISRLWRGNGHDGGQENNDGNSLQHTGSGYKLNSSSISEFRNIPDKGLENVCSTGDQGPVSSWTCPSD